MIDTDKYEGLIDAEGYIDYDGLDHLLAEVKRLSALADALFNLIPSHLSTEATDVWNEHMGDEEE